MINTSHIKAIIVDLDRTLLHTDKTLSEYTTNILKECKKSGFHVMVATARPLRTIRPYSNLVDFDAMVVSNGARIIHKNQRMDFRISRGSAEHLLNSLKTHPNLRVTLETGDCAYSNHPIKDYDTILNDNLTAIANKEGTLKILVHLDSDEALSIVRKELTEDLYDTIAHDYLLQIMNRSATKWNGIRSMLDICNFSPDEAVYFGDDQDDIEPIKMCGLGIAVSNGIEEAKAAADYVVDSNDADGVARFIENQLLKNL